VPLPQQNMLIGAVHLHHPSAVERDAGEQSRAYLTVSRGLKSGALDDVPVSETQLLKLIESAAAAIRVIRGLP
jgi:hypothetical protein